MIRTSKLKLWILAVVLAGSSWLYLIAITPDRFGSYHDDGIYVVTAKALATGQGYRIISLPYEPAQTKFPPLYPFLLSLIWRVYPQFPENLIPMMVLSVVATIMFLALTWCYLAKEGYASWWQALLVVALTAISRRTVIFAAGIYSEMFYAVLSVAGLWLAEVYEKERRSWITGIIVGGLVGVAFLTRIAGITLLIAVVLFFVLRRQFGKAFLLFAVGSLFVLAWGVWVYSNGSRVESVNAAFYTSYFRDFRENVSDLRALLNVLGTNTFGIIFISIPLICLGLDYTQLQNVLNFMLLGLAFVLIVFGFLKHTAKGLRLSHIYLILYLALHLAWPYTAHDRFLIPILPFLLLFLIAELGVLIHLVRDSLAPTQPVYHKLGAVFVSLALLIGVGSGFFHYGSGIERLLASKQIHVSRASEDARAIAWIKAHTAPSDVVLSYRDPLYYLYTGRKAARSLLVKAGMLNQDEAAIYERAKMILRIISENDASYVVRTSSDFEYDQQAYVMRKNFALLVERYRQTFVPVFKCGDECNIYRISVRP